MIRVTLEFESPVEAAAFISMAGSASPIATITTKGESEKPLEGGSVIDADVAASPTYAAGAWLDIRYSNTMPDHLMCTLRTADWMHDGFHQCWHRALPAVNRMIKHTNIFFQCKRLRLIQEKKHGKKNARKAVR